MANSPTLDLDPSDDEVAAAFLDQANAGQARGEGYAVAYALMRCATALHDIAHTLRESLENDPGPLLQERGR